MSKYEYVSGNLSDAVVYYEELKEQIEKADHVSEALLDCFILAINSIDYWEDELEKCLKEESTNKKLPEWYTNGEDEMYTEVSEDDLNKIFGEDLGLDDIPF